MKKVIIILGLFFSAISIPLFGTIYRVGPITIEGKEVSSLSANEITFKDGTSQDDMGEILSLVRIYEDTCAFSITHPIDLNLIELAKDGERLIVADSITCDSPVIITPSNDFSLFVEIKEKRRSRRERSPRQSESSRDRYCDSCGANRSSSPPKYPHMYS